MQIVAWFERRLDLSQWRSPRSRSPCTRVASAHWTAPPVCISSLAPHCSSDTRRSRTWSRSIDRSFSLYFFSKGKQRERGKIWGFLLLQMKFEEEERDGKGTQTLKFHSSSPDRSTTVISFIAEGARSAVGLDRWVGKSTKLPPDPSESEGSRVDDTGGKRTGQVIVLVSC